MRWFFVCCILLATATDVLSRHRTKRDLSYIKNLIASKILGTETIYVNLPEVPKNETYQLFKIQGYDDILLKVTKKPHKKENRPQEYDKVKDPVIVKPDIAIIGSYLGTSTQSETLLAIDIAKNLVKSGILNSESDKLIHQVVVPMTPQLQEQVELESALIGQKNPSLVYPQRLSEAERIQIVNRMPEFPVQMPALVASEIKYRPNQPKYSYIQKGENADMTHESYNNQDVIVTRTEKEPPLPQYIKMRFADVASIGANPYVITPRQPIGVMVEEHLMPTMNVASVPYAYMHPSMVSQQHIQPMPSYIMQQFPAAFPSYGVIKEPGYVVDQNIRSSRFGHRRPNLNAAPLNVPTFVQNSKQALDMSSQFAETEFNYINQYLNGELNKFTDKVSTPKVPSNTKVSQENEANSTNNKAASGDEDQRYDLSKTTETNGIVSKYMYKQINSQSPDNFTVVKLEDSPRLIQGDPLKRINVFEADKVPNDFVYMPPENVNVPPPNMIPKTNNMNDHNTDREGNFETQNQYNHMNKSSISLKAAKDNTGTLKTSETYSLKNNPIVVLGDENSNDNPLRNKADIDYTHLPYKGGPVF